MTKHDNAIFRGKVIASKYYKRHFNEYLFRIKSVILLKHNCNNYENCHGSLIVKIEKHQI